MWTSLGNGCGGNATLSTMHSRPACMWHTNEIVRAGPAAFGYTSFEAMWADYFVFTTVRNPYTRAASSYDYIYARHEVRAAFVLGCHL